MTTLATGNRALSSPLAAPCTAPILIGSSPSAGSSLLRVLVSRLCSFTSGGELGVFDKPHLFALSPRRYHSVIRRWILGECPADIVVPTRLFAQLEGYPVSRDEVVSLAALADDYGDLLKRFFALLLERTGRVRWLEKTPGNVFGFGPARAIFPLLRTVHIVRDGRDVVASLVARGLPPFHAASRWYAATIAGSSYRAQPWHHEIRYEDLVGSTHDAISRLCTFAGEPFDPALLVPDAGIDTKDPAWRNDHNAAVSASSIGRWREVADTSAWTIARSVRLTRAGMRLAGRSRDSALPTPDELQAMYGYEPFPAGARSRTGTRVRIAWNHLSHQLRSLRACGHAFGSPTRLARS